MSRQPLPDQDVLDSYIEQARIKALDYQHLGVPGDLAEGEGEITPHLRQHIEREVDGDFVWYDYTYTVVFRKKWAVDLDELGTADYKPYRV